MLALVAPVIGYSRGMMLILLLVALVLAIIALVYGRISKRQRAEVSGMSVLTLLFSANAVIQGPVWPEIHEARDRAKTNIEKQRLRDIGQAIEAFRRDNETLPLLLTPELTTPVSYLKEPPRDGFSREGSEFLYLHTDTDWVLVGQGQDRNLSTVWRDREILPLHELNALSYDPTNGSISEGDLIFSSMEMKRSTR
ncbi:hypothetical protein KQI84_00555 [bacterium]|nr:hypothetical protein [bacterium]